MATVNDLIRFKGPGQVSFADANSLLSSGNNRTMEAVKGLQETLGNTVDEVESNVLAKAQQVIDSYSLADFDNPDGLAMYDMASRLDDLANDTGMLNSGVTHNYAKARQKELLQDKADRAELFKSQQEIAGTQREQDQLAKTAKIGEAAQATRYISKMRTDVAAQIAAFRAENGDDAELPDHLVMADIETKKHEIAYAEAFADILNDPAAAQNLYDTIFSTENEQEIARLKKDSWVQKLVSGEQNIDLKQQRFELDKAKQFGNSVEAKKAEYIKNMTEGSIFAKAFSVDPTTGAPTVNAAMLNKNVEARLGVIASDYNNALDMDPARYQQQTSWKDKFGDDEQDMRRAFNSAIQDYQKDKGVKLSARQINLLYDAVGTQGVDSSANIFFNPAELLGLGDKNKIFNSARNMIYKGIPQGLQNVEQFEKEGMASSYRKFFAELASDAAAINMSPEELFGTTMGIKPDNGYFDFLPETAKTRLLNASNKEATGKINEAANTGTGTGTNQNTTGTTPTTPAKDQKKTTPEKPITDVEVAIKAEEERIRKLEEENGGKLNTRNENPKGLPDSRYPQVGGRTVAGTVLDKAYWKGESRQFAPSKKTSEFYRDSGTPVLKEGVSMGRIKFGDKSRVNSRYTTHDLARDLGVNKGFLDFIIKAQGVDAGSLSKGEWARIMSVNYASAVKKKKIPLSSLNYYLRKK